MNFALRSFRATPAIALVVAALSTTPAAADAPVTWLGVTLGAPIASLRESKGDPPTVRRYPDDSQGAGVRRPAGPIFEQKARYWLGGTTFLIVTERRGRIVAIEAFHACDAVCPTTNAERDFFFDITSYFGK